MIVFVEGTINIILCELESIYHGKRCNVIQITQVKTCTNSTNILEMNCSSHTKLKKLECAQCSCDSEIVQSVLKEKSPPLANQL